jgi:nicotinamide-nucleotide amidase
MNTAQVLATLKARGFKLAIAESLTGGALSAEFVSVPGASEVLLGSVVAYQSELKHELLGVSKSLLETSGPIDPQVAAQMAGGVRSKLANKTGIDENSVIGIATTGVAGPDSQGGAAPGTVFIAISAAVPIGELVYAHEFSGERNEVRAQAVTQAIAALGECLAI